jgi:hypothetical protein
MKNNEDTPLTSESRVAILTELDQIHDQENNF